MKHSKSEAQAAAQVFKELSAAEADPRIAEGTERFANWITNRIASGEFTDE